MMSEMEFARRSEYLLKSLEKTKTWYKSAAIAFLIAFLVFVSSSGVTIHRINSIEEQLKRSVSIRSIELLLQSTDANTEALINLVNKDQEAAARIFNERTKKINEGIFMYTTEIRSRK